MTWTTIDSIDYIVLYSLKGQTIEAVLNAKGSPTVKGSSTILAHSINGTVAITGTASGISVVSVGSTRIIIADKETAYTFWNPRLSTGFNVGPPTSSILVVGPYLVRNVTLKSSVLEIYGDTNGSTTIDVIAPSSVHTFKWNSQIIKLSTTVIGTKRGEIGFKFSDLAKTIPSLKNLEWKCADSLPEIQR